MQHCPNSHQSLSSVKNTQRYEWSHGQSRNETEPPSDHDGRARAAQGNIYLTVNHVIWLQRGYARTPLTAH